MGLRCLLGHDYGETQAEREREERGDELVVTVTEVEECTRCGDTRVVSENTEVTSLSTPSEPDGTAPRRTGPTPAQEGDPTATDPTEAVVDEDVEVVIDDADGGFGDTGGDGFDGPAESTGEQTVETDRPTTDDAEILDGHHGANGG
jgi:septal ring-binding cell division protein DamX